MTGPDENADLSDDLIDGQFAAHERENMLARNPSDDELAAHGQHREQRDPDDLAGLAVVRAVRQSLADEKGLVRGGELSRWVQRRSGEDDNTVAMTLARALLDGFVWFTQSVQEVVDGEQIEEWLQTLELAYEIQRRSSNA